MAKNCFFEPWSLEFLWCLEVGAWRFSFYLIFCFILQSAFFILPKRVSTIADQLPASLNQVTLPDLWQQQAVAALRAGQDVVVHAPTGAGKTLIFELWSNGGKNRGQATQTEWDTEIAPILATRLKDKNTPLVRYETAEHQIHAVVSIADLPMRTLVDAHGVALHNPPAREVMPDDCARCHLVPTCRALPAGTGTALLWRRLGLVDAAGVPTRRGQIVSSFSAGDGLAIAAALEDQKYPLEELMYDLANLEAGYRFSLDDTRWSGRLAFACHQCYGNQTVPGYLENGLPPKYGSGAETIVASVNQNPAAKAMWITDLLGAGDIDRIVIEWRSLLRQITHVPEFDWPRWTEFQQRARTLLAETESPTLTDLPPLEYKQTKRIEHRLPLRRH